MENTRFTMRENKLTSLVILIFNEYLNYIAYLDVGIVAEFTHGDDAIALVADVNHCLTLVEGNNGSFNYIFISRSIGANFFMC